jgi:hypothetical protein
MTDHILSSAHRRVAAELGNLTDHQQNIFAWVAGKFGWKPGSRWGNYSTPSATLRDVQAVAKKGHLVLDESGTYVVSDEAKALIAAKYATLRAEEKAKDEARMAAYDAQQYVVIRISRIEGTSMTVGGIFTGRDGSKAAHAHRNQLAAETPDSYKLVVVEMTAS